MDEWTTRSISSFPMLDFGLPTTSLEIDFQHHCWSTLPLCDFLFLSFPFPHFSIVRLSSLRTLLPNFLYAMRLALWLPIATSSLALLPLLGSAQDGSLTGPTTTPNGANYSCDATQCELPDCNCASQSPPGGLSPVCFPFKIELYS